MKVGHIMKMYAVSVSMYKEKNYYTDEYLTVLGFVKASSNEMAEAIFLIKIRKQYPEHQFDGIISAEVPPEESFSKEENVST